MRYLEGQKFNQWWLWALNFAVLGLMIFLGWQAYNSGDTLWRALLPLLIAGITFASIALIELRTTIEDNLLTVRFWPFVTKRFHRDEIAEAYVRKYDPLMEYGGWGVRFGGKNGRAYNVMGNQGLQLRLKNGEKWLVGTQRPEELKVAIRAWLDDARPEDVTLDLAELERRKEKRLR